MVGQKGFPEANIEDGKIIKHGQAIQENNNIAGMGIRDDKL